MTTAITSAIMEPSNNHDTHKQSGSRIDLRHSYLDTDENLLSADFESDKKVRLDSRMQVPNVQCDAESTRIEIETLFDEAEKRARELSTCLRMKINLVLQDFDQALAEVGVKITESDHAHNIEFDTFCSLYQGLYEVVEMTVQHLICIPNDLIDQFDQDRIVITKALILDKCRQYFNLVHINSYSFISCCHECSINFNHAKVVKFIELLLQPIQDVKFIIGCLNTMAKYVGQALDPELPEHQELLYITTTYSSLDSELEELTGYPDFIPVHLNLQIKFDEIRHKESHQMRCLLTVKQHLEDLKLFANSDTQPFILPQSLSLEVYQNFLLHPNLIDMVFGNCMDVIAIHESLLNSLDTGFLEYVNRMPELTAEYCCLISRHYSDNREVYGALIGEVVYTAELIEMLVAKCPEFAYFVKFLAEKSQKTLTPHRGKYSLAGVYRNIARHIMSYSNFFAVIEELCQNKTSSEWDVALEKVQASQYLIKNSIKYLNDISEARCLAHSCLGSIAELPLCVLFSRSQNLLLPPTIVKFGFTSKTKDEALLYFFSGLIEIAHKKRPYSLLLSSKEETKTQSHTFHLHLNGVRTWKIGVENSTLMKITPSLSAICSLVLPSEVQKGLGCKHASDTFDNLNGGSKSSIFIKFPDSALKETFLLKLQHYDNNH